METGLVQVANYCAGATYADSSAAAVGLVTGGKAPRWKNEDKMLPGIGGKAAPFPGGLEADNGSIEFVVLPASKDFLNLAIPASATADGDAVSLALGSGSQHWLCEDARISKLELRWEAKEALRATVDFVTPNIVYNASALSAKAISGQPFSWARGKVQVGSSVVNTRSITISLESKYEPVYLLTDPESRVAPIRRPDAYVRTGLEITAELETTARFDANIEDESPTPPGNIIVSGTSGTDTITVTLDLSDGITTSADEWGFEPDGLVVYKYAFKALVNQVRLTIE